MAYKYWRFQQSFCLYFNTGVETVLFSCGIHIYIFTSVIYPLFAHCVLNSCLQRWFRVEDWISADEESLAVFTDTRVRHMSRVALTLAPF